MLCKRVLPVLLLELQSSDAASSRASLWSYRVCTSSAPSQPSTTWPRTDSASRAAHADHSSVSCVACPHQRIDDHSHLLRSCNQKKAAPLERSAHLLARGSISGQAKSRQPAPPLVLRPPDPSHSQLMDQVVLVRLRSRPMCQCLVFISSLGPLSL